MNPNIFIYIQESLCIYLQCEMKWTSRHLMHWQSKFVDFVNRWDEESIEFATGWTPKETGIEFSFVSLPVSFLIKL